jgi:arylsulfatase A-like enzyme
LYAFLIAFFVATIQIHAQDHPNVVLIFADDLGYGDLSCYGATKIKTPNIDGLARDGRRFTDAHSSSAVCTPSRYGLLTGRYPLRRGLWGPSPVTSPLLIDTERLTIADLLKNAGYSTSIFGKWHLGFGTGTNHWKQPLRPGPQDLGFDYAFTAPVVNSAPPYVFVENDKVFGGDPNDPLVYLGRNAGNKVTPITPLTKEHGNRVGNMFGGAKEAHKTYNDFTLGTTLAERASNWITEQPAGKPFFLYLSTTNIHHPFTPAPQFQGTSECGLYGDFVHELDWMVGKILKTLDDKGVADNTLVIFTSDNGGMFNHGGQTAFKMGHRVNGDLLGFKFGGWEGGHRVPFIARWPGNIKPGTVSKQLISGVDMMATLAAVTGQELKDGQGEDSVNILPALTGDPTAPVRETLVITPHKSSNMVVRKGKWVYIGAQGSGGFRGGPGSHAAGGPVCASFVGSINSDFENGKYKADAPPAQLYDLEADPSQTKNLYNEQPEVAKSMKALLDSYKQHMVTRPPRGKAKPKGTPGPVRRSLGEDGRGKPAKRKKAGAATPFNFESGTLAPWTVVEGNFGHPIGSRDEFFRGGEYNKQGKYYLTTLEPSGTAVKGMDAQTGVIQSPSFTVKGGALTFRVGGGSGNDTYVALCTADGKEVQQARGTNSQTMVEVSWDLTAYAGKSMFIKVVDKSTSGWGHITADDFQFDGDAVRAQAVAPQPVAPQGKATGPNVVLINADDLGYGDLGCYGATKVKTPHLDRMAKEGRRYTDAHSPSGVCSPSRYGLLTGQFPLRRNFWGPTPYTQELTIADGQATIANVLKSRGYATACIGKWHLGFGRGKTNWNGQLTPGPVEVGFDYYFGMPTVNSGGPFVYVENHSVVDYDPKDPFVKRSKQKPSKTEKWPAKGMGPFGGAEKAMLRYRDREVGTEFAQRAVKWIDERAADKQTPFFLYLATTNIHHPFTPAKRFDGTSDCGRYGDYIHELDWMVGEVLTALDKHGLSDNTLVVFTSDNGGMLNEGGQDAWRDGHRLNGKLQGFKFGAWEGGHRVPFLVRWPGTVPAGTVSDALVSQVDLLPTFAAAAGAAVPTDAVVDGVSQLDEFTGKATEPARDTLIISPNSPKHLTVRHGKWVYIPARDEGGFQGKKVGDHLLGGAATQPLTKMVHSDVENGKIRPDAPRAQLYDLEADPFQKVNVYAEHPETVARLDALLKTWRAKIPGTGRLGWINLKQ